MGFTRLPHFDPDLDRDPLPASVAALRDLLAGADAVVLCTPEYAGALPGAFKNALDWTVGSTVYSDKPVAWIKVTADARRGEGAHAELATVLGYVQARVLPEACTRVPIDRSGVDADGLLADEMTVHAVTDAIAAVLAAIPAADPQSQSPSSLASGTVVLWCTVRGASGGSEPDDRGLTRPDRLRDHPGRPLDGSADRRGHRVER